MYSRDYEHWISSMNLNVLWTDVGKEQELESEGWIEFGSLEGRGKWY